MPFQEVNDILQTSLLRHAIRTDPDPARRIPPLPASVLQDFELNPDKYLTSRELSLHSLLAEPLGRHFLSKFADVKQVSATDLRSHITPAPYGKTSTAHWFQRDEKGQQHRILNFARDWYDLKKSSQFSIDFTSINAKKGSAGTYSNIDEASKIDPEVDGVVKVEALSSGRNITGKNMNFKYKSLHKGRSKNRLEDVDIVSKFNTENDGDINDNADFGEELVTPIEAGHVALLDVVLLIQNYDLIDFFEISMQTMPEQHNRSSASVSIAHSVRDDHGNQLTFDQLKNEIEKELEYLHFFEHYSHGDADPASQLNSKREFNTLKGSSSDPRMKDSYELKHTATDLESEDVLFPEDQSIAATRSFETNKLEMSKRGRGKMGSGAIQSLHSMRQRQLAGQPKLLHSMSISVRSTNEALRSFQSFSSGVASSNKPISKAVNDDVFKENMDRVKQVNIRIERGIEQVLRPIYEQFISDLEAVKDYMKFKRYSEEPVRPEDVLSHRIIGKGAFGSVYGCVIAEVGVLMAMKVMEKKRVKYKNARSQVVAEKMTLKMLAEYPSPYCMQLRYSFQTRDSFNIVMPLATGGDLKFHLKGRASLEPRRAKIYLAEIAFGLGHLHQLGIIMRDLKPRNVLIDGNGHCKISDFGLAIRINDATHKGRAGTEGYWSPEVINQQEYSYDCDWWSFGCMMFEMLTGINPFASRYTGLETRNEGTLSGRIAFADDFDPAARELITGLLTVDFKQRFCTSREGLEELLVRGTRFWKGIDLLAIKLGYHEPAWVPEEGRIYAEDQQKIEQTNEPQAVDTVLRRMKLTKNDEIDFEYFADVQMHQADIVKIIHKVDNTRVPRLLKDEWTDLEDQSFRQPKRKIMCCTIA